MAMKTIALPIGSQWKTRQVEASALLDMVMPVYEVRTRRTLQVRAPAQTLYRALEKRAAADTTNGLTVLVRRTDRELLLGSTGLHRARAAGAKPADAWCAYQAYGSTRAAVSLRVVPIDHQTARLVTETRVHSRGLAARVWTRRAWTLFGPASRLRRHSLPRAARATAERATGLFLLTALD
jgi:hypothetical protein